jgi:hypothetical protein
MIDKVMRCLGNCKLTANGLRGGRRGGRPGAKVMELRDGFYTDLRLMQRRFVKVVTESTDELDGRSNCAPFNDRSLRWVYLPLPVPESPWSR